MQPASFAVSAINANPLQTGPPGRLDPEPAAASALESTAGPELSESLASPTPGLTPLLSAAATGQLASLRILVALKADPEARASVAATGRASSKTELSRVQAVEVC